MERLFKLVTVIHMLKMYPAQHNTLANNCSRRRELERLGQMDQKFKIRARPVRQSSGYSTCCQD